MHYFMYYFGTNLKLPFFFAFAFAFAFVRRNFKEKYNAK